MEEVYVISDSDSDQESSRPRFIHDVKLMEQNVKELEDKLRQTIKALEITDVANLPDKGERLFTRRDDLQQQLNLKQHELNKVLKQPREMKENVAVAEQITHIKEIEDKLRQTMKALETSDVKNLPDKGERLFARRDDLQQKLNLRQLELNKLLKQPREMKENVAVVNQNCVAQPPKPMMSWNELQSGLSNVLPKTFGKTAMATYNTQKALTSDTLEHIHSSIMTRPPESELANDPEQLKITLMPHQKYALNWLQWRESKHPSGGILADDMGLGKTISLISLILNSKSKQFKDGNKKDKYDGGTLVVAPTSVMHQWKSEIETKCRSGCLSVYLYHGNNRETSARRLAKHDVVITTYSICLSDFSNVEQNPIFRIHFERIILDEAHNIRNYKTKTAQATFLIHAKHRWCLTGTPVHNKELDIYALLKFLRCAPFDDYLIWKRWVSDKSAGGQERLNAVLSSLMLRRTKQDLLQKGHLNCLPSRNHHVVKLTFSKEEFEVYQKLLIFSKELFRRFLKQKPNTYGQSTSSKNNTVDDETVTTEYNRIRDHFLKSDYTEITQTHILILLLRLRQICCHPCLIKTMLKDENDDIGQDLNGGQLDADNLIDRLVDLSIRDDDVKESNNEKSEENAIGFNTISKDYLNAQNAIFQNNYKTTKISELLRLLKETILPSQDKVVIVSQWRSYLLLISEQLTKEKTAFHILDGTIPTAKRGPIIEKFNSKNDNIQVLLLTLTSGGVGLNLIGANHLILLDPHWNPQLENQAYDRIYRVGQTKSVFLYSLIIENTVEEYIKILQEKKLAIADDVLTGSKNAGNKLTMDDLKLLFAI